MKTYKQQFIEFMVRSKVLTFGDFMTKSGRKTPFFINTGNYKTGEQIKKLGQFYAQAIIDTFTEEPYNVLFGPAYKGIPLVVTTAIALSELFEKNVSFCFNRKEQKDHGEGGTIVGHRIDGNDHVLIIEDVTTAGTSIRETYPLLKKAGTATVTGLIVSVDRMEKGTHEKSALTELAQEFDMKTTAIVTLDDIVDYLHNRPVDGKVFLTDEHKKKIDLYRQLYGAHA